MACSPFHWSGDNGGHLFVDSVDEESCQSSPIGKYLAQVAENSAGVLQCPALWAPGQQTQHEGSDMSMSKAGISTTTCGRIPLIRCNATIAATVGPQVLDGPINHLIRDRADRLRLPGLATPLPQTGDRLERVKDSGRDHLVLGPPAECLPDQVRPALHSLRESPCLMNSARHAFNARGPKSREGLWPWRRLATWSAR